jgi:hypothetical protein
MESFVRSIIAAHAPMLSRSDWRGDQSQAVLGIDRSICRETEAQSLLRALEDFIRACTRPPGISQLDQTASEDTGEYWICMSLLRI